MQKPRTRLATPTEVATYRAAVQPLLGNPAAVKALRIRMKLFVNSRDVRVLTH